MPFVTFGLANREDISDVHSVSLSLSGFMWEIIWPVYCAHVYACESGSKGTYALLTYGLCFCSGNGLGPEDRSSLLASCVSFLSVPVDADALNAVLRLCLRFTQDFRSVLQFQTQTQSQQVKQWFYKLPPAELATARFSKSYDTAMQQHGEK